MEKNATPSMNQTSESTMFTEFNIELELLDEQFYDYSVQLRFAFGFGWGARDFMFSNSSNQTLKLGPESSRATIQVFKVFLPENGAKLCELDAKLEILPGEDNSSPL